MTYCSNYCQGGNLFYGVDFDKAGLKQLRRANKKLAANKKLGANSSQGVRPLDAETLEKELGTYLAAHEAAGVHFDTECQEIRYDDGVYFLLRKMQGWWYITDVIVTDVADAPDTFLPIYTVRNVLRGLFSVIKLVFTGWWPQKGKTEKKVVIL